MQASKFLIFVLLMSVASTGHGAVTERLGDFDRWTAFKTQVNKTRICYISSRPTRIEGKTANGRAFAFTKRTNPQRGYKGEKGFESVERGETFAFVTHRPEEGVKGEVSFLAGYPLQTPKEDSKTPLAGQVEVQIGEHRFYLFTKGQGAWVRSPEDERELVRKMIQGEKMIVRGLSMRNTLTIDTYSLLGFTKAYTSISEACKT